MSGTLFRCATEYVWTLVFERVMNLVGWWFLSCLEMLVVFFLTASELTSMFNFAPPPALSLFLCFAPSFSHSSVSQYPPPPAAVNMCWYLPHSFSTDHSVWVTELKKIYVDLRQTVKKAGASYWRIKTRLNMKELCPSSVGRVEAGGRRGF